jgi:ribonucleoside-diphosphate reductase alpha chain
MATSVIDYIFRDLAISYLKRVDLGQVKPEDLLATGTKGDSEGTEAKPRHSEKDSPAGSAAAAVGKPLPKAQTGGQSPALKAQGASSPSAALLQYGSPQAKAAVLEQDPSEESEVLKIVNARIKGYEGDPCSSCGYFTLIRNGTCMKCDTCGSTTGCS